MEARPPHSGLQTRLGDFLPRWSKLWKGVEINQIGHDLSDLPDQGWALVAHGRDDFLDFASSFGVPAPSSLHGPLVDRLEAQDADEAKPHSLSIEVGRAQFPWHTDGCHWPRPPRYVFLRYIAGEAEAATLLLGFESLALTAEDTRLLRKSIFRIVSPRGRFLTTILESRGTHRGDVFRFDQRVLRPAMPDSGSAVIRMHEALALAEPIRIQWEAGQVLVIDNWRTLHSREAVVGARTMERIVVIA